jgi:hypothetical protein
MGQWNPYLRRLALLKQQAEQDPAELPVLDRLNHLRTIAASQAAGVTSEEPEQESKRRQAIVNEIVAAQKQGVMSHSRMDEIEFELQAAQEKDDRVAEANAGKSRVDWRRYQRDLRAKEAAAAAAPPAQPAATQAPTAEKPDAQGPSRPRTLLLESPHVVAPAVPPEENDFQQQPQNHGKRRMQRGRDLPGLAAVEALVKDMHAEGRSHEQICERLGRMPRPPRVAWNHLSWPEAIKTAKYRSAVKTKLSKMAAGKSFSETTEISAKQK